MHIGSASASVFVYSNDKTRGGGWSRNRKNSKPLDFKLAYQLECKGNVSNCLALCVVVLFCVCFLLIFYMLINHLLKKKQKKLVAVKID